MRCDDQRLSGALAIDDLDADDELSAHLDHCVRCRSKLLDMAGDASWWEQAGEAPSEASIDSEVASATSIAIVVDPSLAADLPATVEPLSLDFLAAPSHPEMLGRLGRYEIECVIGAGGMGVVLKGFDTELHRPVAIKALAPYLASSGAARARFAREAQAAAAIVHDHVLPIHNVESKDAVPYLVMPYVAGPSLQNKINQHGALPIKDILRIGLQTAQGLSAAHAQGIVHRDVKPANILLEDDVDRVLISDFGLARAADDASVTRSGVISGTPQYMSPEQARGDLIDPRSDLFSLGIVMYSMATGRAPFRGKSTMGVLRRVCEDDPRPIRELNPDCPDWLEAVVFRLLAKSPEDRFGSAAELARWLEQALAHVQQPACSPLPAWEAPLAASRRANSVKPRAGSFVGSVIATRWIVAGVLAVAALLTVVTVVAAPALSTWWGPDAVGKPAEDAAEVAGEAVVWDDDVELSLMELEADIEQLESSVTRLIDGEGTASRPPNEQ